MSLLPLVMSLSALSKTALDLSNRARSDELIFVKPPRSGGLSRQSRTQTEFYAQQIDLGEFYRKPNDIDDETEMEMSGSSRVDAVQETMHTGYNNMNDGYSSMHDGHINRNDMNEGYNSIDDGYGFTNGIGRSILPSNFPENYHTEFPPFTRGKF